MILSEEFAFPLEDGTGPIIDEMEKEKEKRDKDLTDCMEKKEKTAEEINKDPNLKDAELTKPFKDKLTLAEPDDEDKLNEGMELDLEEALPKDLAHAFRNFTPINTKEQGEIYSRHGGYKDINGTRKRSTVDFNNADYRVATPEEIFQLKKDGNLDKALIVFDGKLVTFSPEGRQITKAERDYKTKNRDVYINDNTGELLYNSKELPFKQMVQKADKLYVIENEPLVDPQLRADRSANPESRYYNPNVNYHDRYGQEDVFGNNTRGFSSWGNELKDDPRSRNSHDRVAKALADRDRKIDKYTKLRDEETTSPYNYYDREINQAKDEKARVLNNYRDSAAAIRNANSNMALKKPLIAYRDLKQQLDIDNRSLARSQTKLSNAQQNGSADTRSARAELENAYNELKSLRRRIMELEDKLDNADLDDAAEVKKYQDEVNNYTSNIAKTQADIDKLLRKNKP